ncbi:uncharacterized protein LOC144446431 [Glandiceps talaboti]
MAMLHVPRFALTLLVVCLYHRQTLGESQGSDLEDWLGIFGPDFSFEIPSLDELYTETNATPSILYGHRGSQGILGALGLREDKQIVKSCGQTPFTLTWEPSGPLKIGKTYTVNFEAVAGHDLHGDGHIEPKIYRDDKQIMALIHSIPYCKFVPKDYYKTFCEINKGDEIKASYTADLKRNIFIKPGHYHGSVKVFNGRHEEMVCLTFDVHVIE